MKLEDLYENNNYENYIEIKNSYLEEDYESIHILRCPNCNRKMIKYTDRSEYQGKQVPYEYWECPNGCNEDEY